MQYFYGHTLVAGSPLEFTAPQGKMVKGFALLLLITLTYQLAANTGQDLAVGLLLLAGAVLAPWIWGSAMRFRLVSTRWRGLRLHFNASWKEVYTASWPVFALALVWMGVFLGLQALSPGLSDALQAVEGAKVAARAPRAPLFHPAMGGVLLLGLLLSVLCFIRLEYNYKSLLVLRTQVGAEAGRWKPVYLDFVKIWLATVAVFVACAAIFGAGYSAEPEWKRTLHQLTFGVLWFGIGAILLKMFVVPWRTLNESGAIAAGRTVPN